jgi:dTDP-4-dehydrorhamnose reductase
MMVAVGEGRPILLVGAGGQVGSALAPRLTALGAVVAATRAEVDLERLDELRALVRRVRPRAIVNAAAYTAVDDAERDVARCRRINADAPGVLAEEAARLGAPLVHYSTNYVFDGEARVPYVEEAAAAPLGVYGATKREGEEAVAAATPAHLILRTAGVYGWTGRNFMRRILALAREREELQVVDDQLIAPTPASIVADATVAALGQLLGPGAGDGLFGTYHLTSGGETSWFGFAERILALDPARAGQRTTRLRAVRSTEFPTAARRPRNGLLDNDKFVRRFGVTLPLWEVALRRTLTEDLNRS